MMFPHVYSYIVPATVVDDFKNPIKDYASGTTVNNVSGWLQQNSRNEFRQEGRNQAVGGWTLFTLTLHSRFDRVLWQGNTFDVEGDPNPLYTPAGLHHYEVALYIVEG